MLVLGVVGAMGSGKTLVLEMFGVLGAATIRADDLSRELLIPDSAITRQVRAEFGDEYFDSGGNLLRGKLAAAIFTSESARSRLNAIMYPAMVSLLEGKLCEIGRCSHKPVMVAVEAANLHEMGGARLVDHVLRVTAPSQVRLRRIQARDELSVDEAQKRLDSHIAAGMDASPANYELNSVKPVAQLQEDVLRLYRVLVGCAVET